LGKGGDSKGGGKNSWGRGQSQELWEEGLGVALEGGGYRKERRLLGGSWGKERFNALAPESGLPGGRSEEGISGGRRY